MEYYKNYDLADIVYFCDFDKIWKTEQWKDVVDFSNYQVSDLGRVKSFKNTKDLILKSGIDSNGYLLVNLYNKGVRKSKKVHKLISITFLNHIPCGFNLVINHKNFIKTDNSIGNLEIVSVRENSNRKHIKSSSKHTGVSWSKSANKWASHIHVNGKLKYLGCFDSELDASIQYQKALYSLENNIEIEIKVRKNSSNFKGVSFNKLLKKWSSVIFINRERKFLGYFNTELEAHLKYKDELLKIK